MTPKPKDKPAGKVKLTKWKVLRCMSKGGLIYTHRSGYSPHRTYYTLSHGGGEDTQVHHGVFRALLSQGHIMPHLAHHDISPGGRRALKESSK